jgi:hypothetical protein
MHIVQSRRDFLASASSAAAVGLLGTRGALADEGPPEVTTLRLSSYPNILPGTRLHLRRPAAR